MHLKMNEMGPAGENRKVGSRGWLEVFSLRRLSGPVLFLSLVAVPTLAATVSYQIQAPPMVPAGQPFWITITVLDAVGNTKSDYVGTTSFTATDPYATVNGLSMDAYNYTWSLGDLGVSRFGMIFHGPCFDIVSASDTMSPSIAASATFLVDGISMKVSKVQNPPNGSTVYPGTPVTYTIIVTNTGIGTITSLTVTDTVSPVLTDQNSSQPTTMGAPTVTQTTGGTQYVWSSSGLAMSPGTSYTFTIAGSAGGAWGDPVITNTAFVTALSACTATRMFTGVVSFTMMPPAPPSGTVAISATKMQFPASVGYASSGDPVFYAVTVANTGDATITSLTLVDTVSPGIMAVTTSQPAGFAVPTRVDVAGGTRYVWSATGLFFRPGTDLTFTLVGTAGFAASFTLVTNLADAIASNGSNTASVTTNPVYLGLGTPAWLGAYLKVTPSKATVGAPLTVVLTLTNSGLSPITGLSATLIAGPSGCSDMLIGFGCGVGEFGTSTYFGYSSGPSPAVPGTLAAGTSQSFTWVFSANGCKGMTFFTCISGRDSGTGVALAAGAFAYVEIDRLPSALAVTPSPALTGQTLSVVMSVTNNGGSTTCFVPSLTTNSGGALVSYVSGPVPATAVLLSGGQTARFTWTYLATGAGQVSFTATALGMERGWTVPPGPGVPFWSVTTTASAVLTINPGPAPSGTLIITTEKQQWPVDSKTQTDPGVQVNYRIIVRNTGTTTITSLSVVDTVSPVVVSVSTDQPAGMGTPVLANTPSGTHYMWSGTGLSFYPGMIWTFTITGLVGPVCGTQTVWNIAYVTAKDGTRTAKEPTNSVYFWENGRTTSIAVSKVQVPPSGASLTPGMNVSYLIVVTNVGTATVSGLSVVDTITPVLVNQATDQPALFGPPTVTQGFSGTRYVWSASGIVMPPRAEYTFTISGTVGMVSTTVSTGNTAFVSAVTACSATSMFTNGEGFTVNPSGSLAFAFAASPSATTLDQAVTLRLTVDNPGPSTVDTVLPVLDSQPGYVSGPVPSGPLSLSPGGSVTFTWDYLAKGQFPVTRMFFSATVTAVDQGTGFPLMRNLSAFVDILPSASLVASSPTAPAQAFIGQTFSVSVTIRNAGNGNASVTPVLNAPPGVTVIYSLPGRVLIPGEVRVFTWTVRADGAGTVTLTPGVAGTDTTTLQPVSAGAPVAVSIQEVTMAGTGTPGCRIICGRGGYCDPWAGQQVTAVVRSSRSGPVTMAVYDMNGVQVGVVQGYCYANYPSYYVWNCRSRCGGGFVPPGGYAVVVTTPQRRYRGRMLINRRWR
jgi:uncharacterized repeat protein (TIGR01451 family)/fimbrial isopeptide formation D2 family protein